MTPDELAALTDEELGTLSEQLSAERIRRATIERAASSMDQVIQDYQTALGRADGAAWVQPTAALDAYPAGAQVSHDGKTWESTTPVNVWEPGVSGWREVTAEDAAPPAWLQPTGGHDAYGIGDVVAYNGKVYQSTIAQNVWSPAVYPTGWQEVESVSSEA